MKRTVQILLALVLMATPSYAAWSHIVANDTCHSPGGVASDPITLPNSVAATSTIVTIFNGGGSTDLATITDNHSNTHTQRVLFSGDYAIYEAANTSGGSLTVTLANGSGLFGQACIFEFDGGAGGYDASNFGSGTGTAVSVGSFATTSGDLLVATNHALSGATLSGTGLTDTGTVVNGVVQVFWGTSTGASSSLSGTLSFSDTWTAGLLAEKASGGGATPKPCTLPLLGVGTC